MADKSIFYDSEIFKNNIKIFDEYLQNPKVVEILINKEKEVITEVKTGYKYIRNNNITKDNINNLLKILANENNLNYNHEHPTISVDSPYEIKGKIDLLRISSVYGEYTENGISLSIRKKNPDIFPPESFFNTKKTKKKKETLQKKKEADELDKILEEKNTQGEIIEEIIKNNRSLLIVGATSTGKSSCLNTIIKNYIPANLRVVTIEDTREIMIEKQKNALQIINRDATNINKYLELLNIVIRLRPDWIIIGEIRSKMAQIFLNFASSGHPTITTLHSDDPEGAIDRLADLIQLEGSTPNKNYIISNIKYIIVLRRGKNRNITSELYQVNQSGVQDSANLLKKLGVKK